MTRTFRYVPHDRVDEFKRKGWTFVRVLFGHHGRYSCLMERK